MSNCKKFKKQIVLLYYNELDRHGKEELLAHIEMCHECKQELASLKQFGKLLQEQDLFDVDENSLKMARNLTRLRLKQQGQKGFVPFSFLQPKPAFQFGFVVMLVMFGFLLGRQNFTPGSTRQTQNQLQQLLTASGSVAAANSNINPYLIGVERLKFNQKDGTVEIQYNTVNDIKLVGNPETPAIKQLLLYAMQNEQNANIRLHAVKAVNAAAQTNRNLDIDYIHSLEQVLQREENAGIKLMALDVLKALPLRENIKNILVRVLLYDPDTPARIQAFKTLTEARVTEQDIDTYLHPAVKDSNTYISYRSAKLLEQLNKQKKGPFELSRKGKQ